MGHLVPGEPVQSGEVQAFIPKAPVLGGVPGTLRYAFVSYRTESACATRWGVAWYTLFPIQLATRFEMYTLARMIAT